MTYSGMTVLSAVRTLYGEGNWAVVNRKTANMYERYGRLFSHREYDAISLASDMARLNSTDWTITNFSGGFRVNLGSEMSRPYATEKLARQIGKVAAKLAKSLAS